MVCLQTVWVGTLAVDTKQRGLRWQQCSMFLCHSQLCTAVLVCAREEERTCQRITEEPIHIPLWRHSPPTPHPTKSTPLAAPIKPSFLSLCQMNIQFSIFPQIAAFIHSFYTLNLAAYPAISATQCRQHSMQYNWHLTQKLPFLGNIWSAHCFPHSAPHHLMRKLKPQPSIVLK